MHASDTNLFCSLRKLSCSKGLRVDLGFFDDLLVPEYHFPAEYWFHSQDGLWVWKYEGNDMYLDLKEPIRCACAACQTRESLQHVSAITYSHNMQYTLSIDAQDMHA